MLTTRRQGKRDRPDPPGIELPGSGARSGAVRGETEELRTELERTRAELAQASVLTSPDRSSATTYKFTPKPGPR